MFSSPTELWLLAGTVLCLAELFLPTAFVAFMMGLSAFAVAVVSLVLPNVNLQVLLWMVFSAFFVLGSRRLIPKQNSKVLEDGKEAQTLTEIPAGGTGRVIYEGNSWRARCADHAVAIAPSQNVIVVGREGTTLIVMPEYLLHS
ncbi:NfeD family protein [Kamptonema sp. UHCC 0994]|uniref:NfeD family protein n=1 Tax=Kamptonema sp. UHCC 0994 TaxID=3031329 RepID=UPI0023B8E830|nr:NfeD family protein [Kamptonema sp. UHCC 0994]MDF0551723.1 NfeD family protein [Kamptonema sp. UHCC 0994]